MENVMEDLCVRLYPNCSRETQSPVCRGWLASGLGWLVGWLVWAGWLPGSFVRSLVSRLVSWLARWLIGPLLGLLLYLLLVFGFAAVAVCVS